MSSKPFSNPFTRREFIQQSGKGLGLLSLSQIAPAFIAQSVAAGAPLPERDKRILVLIQLAGGNDGLNTVVPFEDDQYYRMRPNIGLKKKEVHTITDNLGLHPACTEMAALFNEGKLGIVQNVGYPNPNRSHFRSMEIWETASKEDEYLNEGWIGRYFDNCCAGSPTEDPLGISIGNDLADAFLSEGEQNIFNLQSGYNRKTNIGDRVLESIKQDHHAANSNAHFLQHTLMNTFVTERRVLEKLEAYRPAVSYPENRLARDLASIAGMIASGMETRVYFAAHGGFDTHANQPNRHQNLLGQLSSAMHAFQADLNAHGLEDQVLTMTFSEFGRRPAENASRGTDHGTAAPLFVMGSQLKGTIHGKNPDLNVAKNKDIAHSIDFRSVYSTILDQWLDADSEAVLGKAFQKIDFVV